MFPASMKPDWIIFGVAMNDDGAAPKVQVIIPDVTQCLGKIVLTIGCQTPINPTLPYT